MKPIYETINVAHNTSLKIASYTHDHKCESAGWHIHPEYELVYVKNGKGLLHIGTATIPYNDGALVFLGPNIPHSDFGNKDFKDGLEVVVQFDKEFIDEKVAVFPEFKAIRNLVKRSQHVLVFDPEAKELLGSDFQNLTKSTSAEKLIKMLLILEKLEHCKVAHTIFKDPIVPSRKNSEIKRLEAIFDFVNTHYHETLTTQIMASEIGLTVNSFCRFFKKMTKKPFVQFVNEFRVRKAVELFNESPHTISEVMYKCGFSDASYFSKQFKKNQGMTPSEYLHKAA
ncbi:MAG: AraC family transcriptional regulator [Flavobacteriaceae bacterium]